MLGLPISLEACKNFHQWCCTVWLDDPQILRISQPKDYELLLLSRFTKSTIARATLNSWFGFFRWIVISTNRWLWKGSSDSSVYQFSLSFLSGRGIFLLAFFLWCWNFYYSWQWLPQTLLRGFDWRLLLELIRTGNDVANILHNLVFFRGILFRALAFSSRCLLCILLWSNFFIRFLALSKWLLHYLIIGLIICSIEHQIPLQFFLPDFSFFFNLLT